MKRFASLIFIACVFFSIITMSRRNVSPTPRAYATYTAIQSEPGLSRSAFRQEIDKRFNGTVEIEPHIKGHVSIEGTGTSGSDQVSHVSVNGVINVLTYEADSSGATDSTAAIQSAITAACPSRTCGKAIYLPVGTYKVSSLNLTNLGGGLRIFGSSTIEGGTSTIQCTEGGDNTGICLDFSGSDYISLDHLYINANTATAPKFAIAFARDSTDLGYSNMFSLSHITVMAKYYPLFLYGAEVLTGTHNFMMSANRNGLVVSAANTAGLSSSFVTTLSGCLSQTAVHFTDSHIQSAAASTAAILIDNASGCTVADFSYASGWSTVNSNGGGLITDGGGLFRGWAIQGVREEGEGSSTTAYFAKFSGQVENFNISNDAFTILGTGTPIRPTVAAVQFNNVSVTSAVSGVVNLRPSDAQAAYPTTVVSCNSASSVLVLPDDKTGGGPYGISCPGAVDLFYGVPTWMVASSGASLVNADFMPLSGVGESATENLEQQMTPYGTTAVITNMRCWVPNAPGTGTSWTFNFRQNGGTQFNCTISNASTTCTNNVAFGITDGDVYDTGITSSGSPATTPGACSYVLRVAR